MFGGIYDSIMTLGGIFLALILAVAAVFWRGKHSGKVEAERDSFERSMRESNELQTRINAGHNAGNRPNVVSNNSDPYDRANRRKRN